MKIDLTSFRLRFVWIFQPCAQFKASFVDGFFVLTQFTEFTRT